MLLSRSLLAASLLTLAAFPAFAQADNAMDTRAAHQEERIEQGKESGQLTDKEATKLENNQEKIDKHIDKAKSDGVVTKGEKHRINKAQNKQSKKIHHKKHNTKHKPKPVG